MVSRACLWVQEYHRIFWESEEEEEEEGLRIEVEKETALPSRRSESFHTRRCLREGAGA